MKKIKKYVKEIWEIISKREMRVLPGNIAFFFMLAFIPILTIIVYIASYFSVSVDTVSALINNVLPGEAAKTIIDIISGKSFDGHIGIFNFATIVVATNGTYSIVNASNTLYNVPKTDHLRDRVKSVWLFIIMLILMLFILVVPIFGDKILVLLGKIKIFNVISDKLIAIFNMIKWPLSIFIIYFNVKLVYIISPSAEVKSQDTTKGAIFTTIGWTIATAIFSLYLKYFAHYDIIYGNLSSIIILMMWLYILAYIFVLGLAINTRVINVKE
jgi:membrane protein